MNSNNSSSDRHYQYAPLIEVVAEFLFEPDTAWPITIPGIIYKEIEAEFPNQATARTFDVNLSNTTNPQLIATDRLQLINKNSSTIVQLSPYLMAVNQLKPYQSWHAYKLLVQNLLDIYVRTAQPQNLRRVALRFINRFEISVPMLDVSDFLDCRPFFGLDFPTPIRSFSLTTEIPFMEQRDTLKIITGAGQGNANPTFTAITLDLEYGLSQPKAISLTMLPDWLESAHTHIQETFEACITTKLRQAFGLLN
jgi:uncharacterized protein (TIGR04255 family)